MSNDKSKNKPNGKSPSPNSWGFKFINHRLGSIDQERLQALDCAVEFPPVAIFDLATAGYKFSLTYDEKNQSFLCSLADINQESPFYQHILTGRGSTAINAWFALAYRHFLLCEGDWSAIHNPHSDAGSSQFG